MKKAIIFTTAISALLTSCNGVSDAEKQNYYGENSCIVQIFAPDTILTFESKGKVEEVYKGSGYYFINAETGKLIQVNGTIVITEK